MQREIQAILAYKGWKYETLANKLGIDRTNFNQQLLRDNFPEKVLRSIADAFDCDLEIRFIDRATGKPYQFPNETKEETE